LPLRSSGQGRFAMIDLIAIVLQGAGCLGVLLAVFFLISLIGSELAERSSDAWASRDRCDSVFGTTDRTVRRVKSR
jgi:hypothetical protein